MAVSLLDFAVQICLHLINEDGFQGYGSHQNEAKKQMYINVSNCSKASTYRTSQNCNTCRLKYKPIGGHTR